MSPRVSSRVSERRQQLPDRRGQRRRESIVAREPGSPGASARRRPPAHRDALRMDRQAEVREAVLDRGQRVPDDARSRGTAPCSAARRRHRDRSRAGSTAPPRFPPRDASRAGSCRRARAPARAPRATAAPCRPRRGQIRDAAFEPRHAVGRNGTLAAARRAFACRASRRDPSAPACRFRCRAPAAAIRRPSHNRASTFGAPGKPSIPRWRASTRFTLPSRIAARSPNANAAMAAAVERPMPGSVAMVRASRGKRPSCLPDDHLRRRVQMMRAPVVAEAAPQLEHAVDRRGGERADVGKRGQKALVVRNDRRHLRLLQHDLREPDPIRIARALPREVVPAVRALPGGQTGRERADWRRTFPARAGRQAAGDLALCRAVATARGD